MKVTAYLQEKAKEVGIIFNPSVFLPIPFTIGISLAFFADSDEKTAFLVMEFKHKHNDELTAINFIILHEITVFSNKAVNKCQN